MNMVQIFLKKVYFNGGKMIDILLFKDHESNDCYKYCKTDEGNEAYFFRGKDGTMYMVSEKMNDDYKGPNFEQVKMVLSPFIEKNKSKDTSIIKYLF